MSDTLREFISEITSKEHQALLAKWAKSYTKEEQDLLTLGLIPVPGKQNRHSFLGQGSYSTAYEVLWKGKHAVAKVTDSKDDIDAVIKLNKLIDDKRIAKNILRVYEVIDNIPSELFTALGIGDKQYVIVVEYLHPLTKQIKDDIFGDNYITQYNKEKQASIKIDDIKEIVKETFDGWKQSLPDAKLLQNFYSSSLFVVFCYELLGLIIEKIELNDDDDPYTSSFSKSSPNFTDLFQQIMLMLQFDSENSRTHANLQDNIEFDLQDTLVKTFVIRSRFPRNRTHSDSFKIKMMLKHPDKRIRSLMNTLLILAKEYKISWHDLHSANIMTRPKTGEFVISDPGLFFFP